MVAKDRLGFCVLRRYKAVNQTPLRLCRGLLLHTFVANAWRRYALQKNLVAKLLVASQEILLQTYVAEWPPEPATNPVFLIHSHKGIQHLRQLILASWAQGIGSCSRAHNRVPSCAVRLCKFGSK